MTRLTLLLGVPLLTAALAPAQQIAGEWHGFVEVKDDAPLRLALHITRDHPLTAAVDSADEGGMGLAVDSITVNGSAMKFEMKSVGGVFEGKIAEAGSRIVGSWTQDGGTWPLTWERGEDPANITKLLDEQEAKRKGRVYTQWFFEGKLSDLWPKLSPVMQQALSSKANLNQFREQIRRQLGKEISLDEEIVKPEGALQVYRRLAKFEKSDIPVEVQFGFDSRGAVAGFDVRPVEHR